jgi:hypothetical protein
MVAHSQNICYTGDRDRRTVIQCHHSKKLASIFLKKPNKPGVWCTPANLAVLEEEARGSWSKASSGQKCETLYEK